MAKSSFTAREVIDQSISIVKRHYQNFNFDKYDLLSKLKFLIASLNDHFNREYDRQLFIQEIALTISSITSENVAIALITTQLNSIEETLYIKSSLGKIDLVEFDSFVGAIKSSEFDFQPIGNVSRDIVRIYFGQLDPPVSNLFLVCLTAPNFPSLDTAVDFPDRYINLVTLSLAKRLLLDDRKEVPQSLTDLLVAEERLIGGTN